MKAKDEDRLVSGEEGKKKLEKKEIYRKEIKGKRKLSREVRKEGKLEVKLKE